MIPLIGLLICFYVGMRGFDWLIVSREAKHNSVYYGRLVIGVVTVLGALLFAAMLIASSAAAPSIPPADYTQ